MSDDDRKLAAEGECEEVLKEQCPAEYSNVDLKDVSYRVGEEGIGEMTCKGVVLVASAGCSLG